MGSSILSKAERVASPLESKRSFALQGVNGCWCGGRSAAYLLWWDGTETGLFVILSYKWVSL